MKSVAAWVAGALLTAPICAAAQTAEPSPGEQRAQAARKAVAEGKLHYYPAKALGSEISGRAAVDCLVEAGGWLTDCRVAVEEPLGWDFGATALAMAPLFKAKPEQAGSRMVVPINFKPPK